MAFRQEKHFYDFIEWFFGGIGCVKHIWGCTFAELLLCQIHLGVFSFFTPFTHSSVCTPLLFLLHYYNWLYFYNLKLKILVLLKFNIYRMVQGTLCNLKVKDLYKTQSLRAPPLTIPLPRVNRTLVVFENINASSCKDLSTNVLFYVIFLYFLITI